jgi:hypothetical protein
MYYIQKKYEPWGGANAPFTTPSNTPLTFKDKLLIWKRRVPK